MLFNSYAFLFVFLPIVLAGYSILDRMKRSWSMAFLLLASLFFYGWWDPRYLVLLIGSIVFNYSVGTATGYARRRNDDRRAYLLTLLGVTGNLALLGYYKYANFFAENLARITGWEPMVGLVVLPLGISFFTFTQIAFLVDSYRQQVHEYKPVHYALFVTYFPHLVAGPILHHREMVPQFAEPESRGLDAEGMAVGLTMLAIGLFKKVVLADGIAPYANASFSAASSGLTLTALEAWTGALSYTFQLYFDFSGYCDMAIGLSRMLGIRLPINFNSPYKAESISDFWRRWHMTLSRFLRDYLYISLGGNRRGRVRRNVNLLTTMVLGGLWHGAGWTFVVWGGLHGLYLVINHSWSAVRARLVGARPAGRAERLINWGLTFTAVVFAWVFFRADDLPSAVEFCKAMVGASDAATPRSMLPVVLESLLHPTRQIEGSVTALGGLDIIRVLALAAIAFALPNSQEWLARFRPALGQGADSNRTGWRPRAGVAVALGAVTGVSVALISKDSFFLYFNF
jgi:alginate O-acetyltransferase complex protein AlgI